MKFYTILLVIVASVIMSSCGDSEADELKLKLEKEYDKYDIELASNDNLTKQQYKEIELAYNQKYVDDLQDLLNNSFEKQLDTFEDGELGFWSTIGHSFGYVFLSEQTRIDKMDIKSKKYFNSIDVKQDAHELFVKYNEDVKNLRARYISKRNYEQKETFIDMPELEISIDNDAHARNNLIIDIFGDIAVWIFVFLVIYFLHWIGIIATLSQVNFQGTLISIIVGVISVVVSVILSIHNDNKLLDSLREQNKTEIIQDFNSILNDLNKNTAKFYENL